jgi:hypothetical protein
MGERGLLRKKAEGSVQTIVRRVIGRAVDPETCNIRILTEGADGSEMVIEVLPEAAFDLSHHIMSAKAESDRVQMGGVNVPQPSGETFRTPAAKLDAVRWSKAVGVDRVVLEMICESGAEYKFSMPTELASLVSPPASLNR